MSCPQTKQMIFPNALTRLLSEFKLRHATPDKQFSEAIRLWNAHDNAGAIKWGRRAARTLDLAKLALAQWLVHRRSDPQLNREALELLTLAAEGGLTEAQQVLAIWYLDGIRVPKDPDKAFELTKRAADAGNVNCQLQMVRFMTLGEYREPDIEAALHYARLAAERGYPEVLEGLRRDLENERILGKTEK